MAKPDCDDGWLKYAHELDSALSLADFSKGQRLVLHEVFAQAFGPGKRREAELSPSDIGRRCGMARCQVSRSIGELVRDGVLTRAGDGLYRFAKDYESWTRDGSPRLSREEVAYCREAPSRALSYRGQTPPKARDYPVTPTVTTQSQGVTTQSRATVTELPRDRDYPVTESVTELPRNPSPPNNPLLGGRIKDFETSSSSDDDGMGSNGQKQTLPMTPARSGPSEAEIQEVREWADRVLGKRGEIEEFGGKVTGFCLMYPPAWVKEAIHSANLAAKRGGLALYVNTCLKNWKASGGPPEGEKKQAAPSRSQPPYPIRDPNRELTPEEKLWKERYDARQAKRQAAFDAERAERERLEIQKTA